jgi:hypothetical protein
VPTSSETRRLIELLLQLSIAPENSDQALDCVFKMTSEERDVLLLLAKQHHVNVRVLQTVFQRAQHRGANEVADWAATLLDAERVKRRRDLEMLQRICDQLERENLPVTVIKSLDHLPDLGSDFDLYTSAHENLVTQLLVDRFKAAVEPRSWGDRLAHKWNFAIPGIPEAIEVHVGRLGQMGEHITLAQRFSSRRVKLQVDDFEFYVPAAEERIIAATLQRIYRHFFFRICDIVNGAAVVKSGALDFVELMRAANVAGIWPGVATYLTVVSDMCAKYRGEKCLTLSDALEDVAWFRAHKLYVSNLGFLRFPILPDAAGLYIRQLTRTAAAGNVAATFRLSLLPPLASVAGLATKLVGNDKGIW